MITELTLLNQNNEEININVIMSFKIAEFGKHYIVYAINDDTHINMSGLEEVDGQYVLRVISDTERKMVLSFYDNIRDIVSSNRKNEIDVSNNDSGDDSMSEEEFYATTLAYIDQSLQEIEDAENEVGDE